MCTALLSHTSGKAGDLPTADMRKARDALRLEGPSWEISDLGNVLVLDEQPGDSDCESVSERQAQKGTIRGGRRGW